MLCLTNAESNDLGNFRKSFEDSELGRNYFASEKLVNDTFREFVEKETLLKAVRDEAVLGFICYMPDGIFHGFAYLHLFTILPQFRGQGFGKRILKLFEEKYLLNRSKVFLVVADFNPKAKSFYEKNGYIQVGKVPGLYKPATDEYLMMKLL